MFGGGIGINVKMLHFYFGTETEKENISSGYSTGDIKLNDFSIGAGYGYSLSKHIGVGAGVKYIRKSVMEYTASTIAGDLGIYYTTMIFKPEKKGVIGKQGYRRKKEDDLRIGFSIQNVGGNLHYIEGGEGDELPITVRLGIGFIPIENIIFGYETKFICLQE
jgi:hypothetical protein